MDARALTWEKRGDKWLGAIDLLIAQSLPDGRFFKSMDTTIDLSPSDEAHDQMLREGFTLTKQIALRGDDYRLHVVVRDVPSRATGSLIIPEDKLTRE